jgi:uncharacterized protein (TIGR00295 family)
MKNTTNPSEFYPTWDTCLSILKNSGTSPRVIRHSIAVCKLAIKFSRLAIKNGKKINPDLVCSGALLHDLGRSETHGVDHGIVGGEIAKKLGLPLELRRIIERHIGSGLTKKEAARVGLPKRDYLPESPEEKIVSHADNLIVEDRKVGVEYVIKRLEAMGLHEAARRTLELHHELGEMCGRDPDQIEPDQIEM